jgi:hypothetical protein
MTDGAVQRVIKESKEAIGQAEVERHRIDRVLERSDKKVEPALKKLRKAGLAR